MAYFAGGCVRDELLGLRPEDYDVATDATPERVRVLFPKSQEVGAAFGVMLVRAAVPAAGSAPAPAPAPGSAAAGFGDVAAREGRVVTIEVATFRSDGEYADKRRPSAVTFSEPRSDAARRDFTINAMFLDPLAGTRTAGVNGGVVGGEVIDFVGGLADLRAGVVRAVGEPEKRLAEDHLRALRAVRFAARFGFEIDEGTAEAIRRHASELAGVSRERIGDELRRFMLSPSRARAARLLGELKLDVPTFGGVGGTSVWSGSNNLGVRHRRDACATEGAVAAGVGAGRFESLERIGGAWARDGGESVPFAVCLGAWAVDFGLRVEDAGAAEELVAAWRGALCLSNEERGELAAVLAGVRMLRSGWAGAAVAVQKRAAAAGWFRGVLALLETIDAEGAERVRERVKELAATASGIGPRAFVLGDDLVAMGMKPGPRFKALLDAVYDAQLEDRVRNPAEARELAKRLGVG